MIWPGGEVQMEHLSCFPSNQVLYENTADVKVFQAVQIEKSQALSPVKQNITEAITCDLLPEKIT